MENQSTTQITGQTSVSDPVSLLHHTHSNAKGKVAFYFAQPIITSKINLPINIFDRTAAIQGHIYAAAWLFSRKRGVAK